MVLAFFRGVCAIVVGVGATLAVCIAGILLGLLQRALMLINIRTHFEAPLFNAWARIIHYCCLERILGVGVELQGSIRPLEPDELALCFGNHPSTIAVGSFTWFASTFVAQRLITVAKYEHQTNPIGWCLQSLHAAIFVDRSDPAQSECAVANGLREEIETPCAIILFPDIGRPSKKNIAGDIRTFRGKIERIEQWLTQTRAPRSGGLHAALQAMEGRRVRPLNFTIALCPRDWSLGDILRRQDRVLRIVVEEVELPTTRGDLELWLNAEWRRKNHIISQWRESP